MLADNTVGEPKLLPQNLAVMLTKPGCTALQMYRGGTATGEGAREGQRRTQGRVIY